MKAVDIHDAARRLYDAQGNAAVAEAARKAAAHEAANDREQAQVWRRIEAALKEMKGPHDS